MDKKFHIYNNFNLAVLVLDSTKKIAYKNLSFINTFGNIKNIEKFSNCFNFDICMLDSENILNANPISFAIASEENFTAHAIYQKTKEKFLYFKISSFFEKENQIIIFEDTTAITLYKRLENKYDELKIKCQELKTENEDAAISQQKAQNQAIKMALMHRVSNIIRESIDLTKIINSTLKELSNLYGATKVYYASFDDKNFTLKNVYPSKYKDSLNSQIELEPETVKNIFLKNISLTPCLKEFLNCEKTFSTPATRIIVPVYRLNKFLGILIIYTNKNAQIQSDILQSISTQLATSIFQASLFQELNKKNYELQNALSELKEAQLQLINSEKMASLGQLVAGVAHEINTPLASINSNNDILKTIISRLELNDEKLKKTFENINAIDKEAIKRISQIVSSLKKFIRLDESELQQADINKEIDLTLELIKHETKKRIQIQKNYSEIPLIPCYPNMLNQVFMNILINACHSIKNSGKITITTAYSKDNLIVSIKDTGEGIDEEIKDKLFSAGTTTKKTGTGLGLAISKKIIEKHNGQITFETQKGLGTEFKITIPIHHIEKAK